LAVKKEEEKGSFPPPPGKREGGEKGRGVFHLVSTATRIVR